MELRDGRGYVDALAHCYLAAPAYSREERGVERALRDAVRRIYKLGDDGVAEFVARVKQSPLWNDDGSLWQVAS